MNRLPDIPARELDVLRQFGEAEVEYLLTGSHAMRFYGVARLPRDVDVVVGTDPDNALKLFKAIERAIGRRPGFELDALTRPKKQIDFRRDGIELDVLTTLPGLEFGEAFAAR